MSPFDFLERNQRTKVTKIQLETKPRLFVFRPVLYLTKPNLGARSLSLIGMIRLQRRTLIRNFRRRMSFV